MSVKKKTEKLVVTLVKKKIKVIKGFRTLEPSLVKLT